MIRFIQSKILHGIQASLAIGSYCVEYIPISFTAWISHISWQNEDTCFALGYSNGYVKLGHVCSLNKFVTIMAHQVMLNFGFHYT